MTKEQRLSCTRGLSQLRRSVPTAALIHGACFLNRRRADTPADVPHGTLEEHADTTMLFESLLEVRRSPLTQPTCSWSKFASNVRWPTLSFSCQKQEFRKWLITNFASGSYSFTAEELNRLIVIIFEEYARQRKVEEMPLS